jgi:hypothetical protein
MDLFFRLATLKATEKVNVETHKAKEDADDFDVTFDDVDLGWAMEGQQQSIAEHYSWQGVVQWQLCSEECCQCQCVC